MFSFFKDLISNSYYLIVVTSDRERDLAKKNVLMSLTIDIEISAAFKYSCSCKLYGCNFLNLDKTIFVIQFLF